MTHHFLRHSLIALLALAPFPTGAAEVCAQPTAVAPASPSNYFWVPALSPPSNLDFAGGGVPSIPGIWKERQWAQAIPPTGLPMEIWTGYFLIRISPADPERNLQILKDVTWIDIYTNDRRALLSIGKGSPRLQAFAPGAEAYQLALSLMGSARHEEHIRRADLSLCGWKE